MIIKIQLEYRLASIITSQLAAQKGVALTIVTNSRWINLIAFSNFGKPKAGHIQLSTDLSLNDTTGVALPYYLLAVKLRTNVNQFIIYHTH